MRARMIGIASIAVGVALGSIGPTPALAEQPSRAATPCAVGTPLGSDFDGDGLAELVVGARRSGAVGLRQQWVRAGDGGTDWLLDSGELRVADLNGDVCADALVFAGGHEPWLKLVPGTPAGLDLAAATELPIPQAADIADDEDRTLVFEAAALRHGGLTQVVVTGTHDWEGSEPYGGYVDVLTLDSGFSVTATQIVNFRGVEAEIRGFGSALATSGRTVAVGAPNTAVSGRAQAGAVLLYVRDSADPTRLVLRRSLTQNSAGVPGSAEEGDRFGAALAMRSGRLVVGAPGEDDGSILDAGLVQPLTWSEADGSYTAHRAISQDTSGVPGSNERRDQFGLDVALARGLTASGSWDAVIGTAEAYGSRADAGSVTVANLTRSLYRTWTQATAGVPGSPEAGDAFHHVGVLQNANGVDTVLIGAPGEDSGGISNVGRVVRSDGKRLTSATKWASVPVPTDAPSGLIHWGWDFGAN